MREGGRPGRPSTTPFRQAWDSFQHALAARYDTNPLVREVSVSSCSSSTGEPFVVSGAKMSQQALAAAGWTTQLQESCLDGALADYSGWTHTPITFAFNALSTPSGPSATFTDQVMRACAGSEAAGGPDCIIGTNDLSATAPSGTWSSLTYAGIAALTVARHQRPARGVLPDGRRRPPLIKLARDGLVIIRVGEALGWCRVLYRQPSHGGSLRRLLRREPRA